MSFVLKCVRYLDLSGDLQGKVAPNTEILICTNRTCRKDGSLQVSQCTQLLGRDKPHKLTIAFLRWPLAPISMSIHSGLRTRA